MGDKILEERVGNRLHTLSTYINVSGLLNFIFLVSILISLYSFEFESIFKFIHEHIKDINMYKI